MSEVTQTGSGMPDAVTVLSVFALDWRGLGGLRLIGLPGPGRDAILALLPALVGDAAPIVRLPVGADDDRLTGGLDLAATLASGRPVRRGGLLAAADGGVLVVSMAERLQPRSIAMLTQALDTRRVATFRDGMSGESPAHFALVALDESLDDDPPLAAALQDRLALTLWTDRLAPRELRDLADRLDEVAAARERLERVVVAEHYIGSFCRAALALGIDSLRAVNASVRVARALAALAGRDSVDDNDAVAAVAMVLSPKACAVPAAEESAPPPPQSSDDGEPPPATRDSEPTDDDLVVAAALAAIPAGLLARLDRAAIRRRRGAAGRGGAERRARRRGRPIGNKPGVPRGGERLDLLATLKTAAPWQPIRGGGAGRLAIVRDDFRVTRYKHRARTTTLFVVDASGSTARQRLGEVKGAIEFLLGECYVRRDEVGLLVFRGEQPELVLSPTRSLARARRQLAALPGGGATPLASAIDSAAALCQAEIRRGANPVVVFMTDGRGNVGRTGVRGDPDAQAQAVDAAREFAAIGVRVLLIDTARRAQRRARELAEAMAASYLALPYASSEALASAVRTASEPRSAA